MKNIQIDDDIYDKLQELALSFVETTPNKVIRRIIDHYCMCENKIGSDFIKPQRRPTKRAYGKLSHEHYRVPIIEALEELGRRGNVDEVLELVFEKVKNKLTDIDFTKTYSGYFRWKNTAHWQHHKMVKDGSLKSDSPRGIWELNSDINEQSNDKTI